MTTRRARERRLVAGLSAALLALVGVVAALWVVERRAGAGAASTAIVPGAVRRIAIERPGRPVIELERFVATAGVTGASLGSGGTGSSGDDGGDWRIVAPCAIDATDARIAPLLDAFASRTSGYSAGEVDLEAAGLGDPLATVRIDGVPILLGGTDLGGERRYALSGERVALVPEWVLSLVDGGLSALAEPVPFPTAPIRVRRLDTTAAAGDTDPATAPEPVPRETPAATLDATPVEPIENTAGASNVADAADAPTPTLGAASAELDPLPWAGLAASQVVAWPVAGAPPSTRRARLEVTLAPGETRTLELVGNASWNALVTADGGCARLFADADLPPDTWR